MEIELKVKIDEGGRTVNMESESIHAINDIVRILRDTSLDEREQVAFIAKAINRHLFIDVRRKQ